MTLDEAIEILEKWYGGGFATRIDDMSPAVKLGIEALKFIHQNRGYGAGHVPMLLPGETEGK